MFNFALQHRFRNIRVNKWASERQSAMTCVLQSSNPVGGGIRNTVSLAPLRAENAHSLVYFFYENRLSDKHDSKCGGGRQTNTVLCLVA